MGAFVVAITFLKSSEGGYEYVTIFVVSVTVALFPSVGSVKLYSVFILLFLYGNVIFQMVSLVSLSNRTNDVLWKNPPDS